MSTFIIFYNTIDILVTDYRPGVLLPGHSHVKYVDERNRFILAVRVL